MTLAELRRAAELLPPGSSINLSREQLLAIVDEPPHDHTGDANVATVADLTVEQTARHFGKAASTIRTWLARGDLPGAYRLHDREWRIPLAAIAAMQHAHSARHSERATGVDDANDGQPADLSKWRLHVPRRAG